MKKELTLSRFSVWAVITALLGPALPPAASAEDRSDEALAALDSAQHVPDEILVQFRTGVSRAEKNALRKRLGAEHLETVISERRREDGGGSLDLLRIPPGRGIADAVRGLEADPAVEFAEPNWIYHHDASADDPYYTSGSLWGMYGDGSNPANQYGSQAGEAWGSGHTSCGDVYVGIIDEGFMYAHEDLAANAWINPLDPVDGLDNDGNGYKDDVHGWDFDRKDNSTYDGTQDDHGTHVAGTIGATGGNGKGVAGVCWSVKMIAAKFLGRAGGTTANAIKAIDYLTDLKNRHGINIAATNNSWGGGGFSQGLYDAIERANTANILFIAAAGNGGSDGVGDNNDTAPHYPSSYGNANIITVAAITSSGAKSSFSNYGATSVDLGAPGSGIFSSLPGKNNSSKYGSYSGTSMATPHVTGAAALYAASHPLESAAQIKTALLARAVATPSLAGKCVTGGRLDASGF
ncbi:MAG: S8 family peptidase [Gammaproteobacteria bacterium]